jgi:hypothetical protein
MGWKICGLYSSEGKKFSSPPKRAQRLRSPPTHLVNLYQRPFLRVTWPGREVEHSPPSSVVSMNKWSYTSIQLTCLHGLD